VNVGKGKKAAMNSVKLSGYIPGAIGRIAELHGKYYYEHWGSISFSNPKWQLSFQSFCVALTKRTTGFG
jgi:hypothetical protein